MVLQAGFGRRCWRIAGAVQHWLSHPADTCDESIPRTGLSGESEGSGGRLDARLSIGQRASGAHRSRGHFGSARRRAWRGG